MRLGIGAQDAEKTREAPFATEEERESGNVIKPGLRPTHARALPRTHSPVKLCKTYLRDAFRNVPT